MEPLCLSTKVILALAAINAMADLGLFGLHWGIVLRDTIGTCVLWLISHWLCTSGRPGIAWGIAILMGLFTALTMVLLLTGNPNMRREIEEERAAMAPL